MTDQPIEAAEWRVEYNKSYYQKNRDRLLEKKRSRYADDPEYRDRVKADASTRRKASSAKGVQVEVLGKLVPAMRVRVVAQSIGKSVSTMNFWQKHGTIPETPYRTPGGYRLYTEEMVGGIAMALKSVSKPSRGDDSFRSVVTLAWRRAGVPC